jgi:hypothetical protein
LGRYYIKSGNPEHPDDKLYNSTLHIKPEAPIPDNIIPKNYVKTSDDFYVVDSFSNELGFVDGSLDPKIVGKIKEIRIHIPTSSETWIIITEINFSSKPVDDKKRLISLLTPQLTKNKNE